MRLAFLPFATLLFAASALSQTIGPADPPEVCGTIAGTAPCSNPALRCCYLFPDYGVCMLRCPKNSSS